MFAQGSRLLARTRHAGGEDNLQFGLPLAGPRRQRKTVVLVREFDHGEKNINGRIRLKQRPGFGSVGGFGDDIPAFAQIGGDSRADDDVMVDHKHAGR